MNTRRGKCVLTEVVNVMGLQRRELTSTWKVREGFMEKLVYSFFESAVTKCCKLDDI